MARVNGEKISSTSGIVTRLYCLEFDQRFWLVALAMVVPHLQVEPLQVHGVLLSIEKRAADSLLPHTCSNHLQAEGKKEKCSDLVLVKRCFVMDQMDQVYLLFHVRAQFDRYVLIVLTTLGYQLRAAQTVELWGSHTGGEGLTFTKEVLQLISSLHFIYVPQMTDTRNLKKHITSAKDVVWVRQEPNTFWCASTPEGRPNLFSFSLA